MLFSAVVLAAVTPLQISEIDARWQPGQKSNAPAFSSTLVLQNVSFPSV